MTTARWLLAILFATLVATRADAGQAAPAERRVAADRAERAAGEIANTGLDALRPARVVIVVAMRAEAQPLIAALRLQENPGAFDPTDPMRAFEGEVGKIKVALVINGQSFRAPRLDLVGPAPAAVTTVAAIKAYHPDLIISAGTAGGMAGARIGDVYLSRKIVYHDRRISLAPAWQQYASGDHAHVKVDRAAADLGVKVGVVATGSSFMHATDDLSAIRNAQAAVVEMEAAAVAEKAADYGVKTIALKAVTDLIEHPDPSQFERNLNTASEALTRKVVETLAYLQRP